MLTYIEKLSVKIKDVIFVINQDAESKQMPHVRPFFDEPSVSDLVQHRSLQLPRRIAGFFAVELCHPSGRGRGWTSRRLEMGAIFGSD